MGKIYNYEAPSSTWKCNIPAYFFYTFAHDELLIRLKRMTLSYPCRENIHKIQKTININLMMKKKYSLFLLMVSSLFLMSSQKDGNPVLTNPFDSSSESNCVARDKIVIISDLHLGNDLSYSETVKHLARLEQFLNEVRESESIKELVTGTIFSMR